MTSTGRDSDTNQILTLQKCPHMIVKIVEFRKEQYLISTDPARLQLQAIHDFLSQSYWAAGRPLETIIRSIENSLCFSLFAGEKQVGFARVVTDYATFAWLCDVFIQEAYRGAGLGKWLLACILDHPDLQGIKRWSLATRDAHVLYRQYGFQELQNPGRFMEKVSYG